MYVYAGRRVPARHFDLRSFRRRIGAEKTEKKKKNPVVAQLKYYTRTHTIYVYICTFNTTTVTSRRPRARSARGAPALLSGRAAVARLFLGAESAVAPTRSADIPGTGRSYGAADDERPPRPLPGASDILARG